MFKTPLLACSLRALLSLILLSGLLHAAAPTGFKSNFSQETNLPKSWSTAGLISIDKTQSAPGSAALLLRRPEAAAHEPCEAVSPTFAVIPGIWRVNLSTKATLTSPDASYRGLVLLEYLDKAGQLIEAVTLADVYGAKPWQPISRQLEFPASAVAARFRVELQKSWGEFRVEALSAVYVGPGTKKDTGIKRLVFSTAQLGNLLFPSDSRVVTISVEATRKLSDSQLAARAVVTDYWGAEQSRWLPVTLSPVTGTTAGNLRYEGKLDLSKTTLEVGRYYEVRAQIPTDQGEPFRNFTRFAILPEAPANAYKPEEIPFTSRDWDNRIPDYVRLSHRLGLRVCGIWGTWSAEPPYEPSAPCIELAGELGMGILTSTPINLIEYRAKDSEKYDDKALRQGVRNWLARYGKYRPVYISLGNEPHGDEAQVQRNIAAYRAVYEEVKKIDPSILCISAAVGPDEAYFRAGFGKWCDVYDFHIYEDSQNVRLAIERIREMAKRYGNPHPVWSTELGLNSQGMAHRAVASEMIRKIAIFFAAGGENVSWFDLLYPDPEGKDAGSSAEAHNVFDSRYAKYCPKLTALSYYNLVNSIAIKKFIAEKSYGDIQSFLYRDKNHSNLLILWKGNGRQDLFLPLPGIQKAQVIRIDGSIRQLDAQGKGLTITATEDPLLISYEGEIPLPSTLNEPAAQLTTAPTALIRGIANEIQISLHGVPASDLKLKTPPFWTVEKISDKQQPDSVRFQVTPPETTTAHEGDIAVLIGPATATPVGELYLRPAIIGQITARLLPHAQQDKAPGGVTLELKNNGAKPQTIQWTLSLLHQITLANGKYQAPSPAEASFQQTPQGKITIPPLSLKTITLPLKNVDSLTAYRVNALLTDSAGRSWTLERNVAGFVSVPKAKQPIKTDGILTEEDWKISPQGSIDQARQYFSFEPKTLAWKGPNDLSATIRYLWDERCLYVGVVVTDDLPGKLMQDDMLWSMDGLQFLVDPCRAMTENVGKYDYCIGVGKKGPQAWCALSADAGAPNGNASDIIVTTQRTDPKSGTMTYELAIPWSRLAPFRPAIGANIGLTMIVNEDDGMGRHSFMTWFGNAHTKEVDTVGDLILTP